MPRPERPRTLRRFLSSLVLSGRHHFMLLYWYAVCLIIDLVHGVSPERAAGFRIAEDVILSIMLLNCALCLYLHFTKESP